MQTESILIVDDHLLNLKMLSYLLSSKGYVVHTAAHAEAALELLNTVRPNLILMDLQLPGMDGLSLTRQLKSNTLYKDIPIIAITAYAMKGDKEKAINAGCDAYIPKPIDTRTLPDTVAQYISQHEKETV